VDIVRLARLCRRVVGFFLLGLFLTIGTPTLSQTPIHSSASQLVERGRSLYANQEFNEAVDLWQQAARTYAEQGDSLNQARALTYLSLAYQNLKQWTDAENAIATSLTLLNAAESQINVTERSRLIAQTLNARGRLELSLGRAETALTTWQAATEVYQQIGDDVGVTGSLINQAQAMEASGLHRRACQTILTALAINHSCEATELEAIEPILAAFAAVQDSQVRVLGLRSFGNVLRLIGRLPQSLQVLEQGLEIAQAMQSPEAESAILLSLGQTQRSLFEQVKDLHQRTGAEELRRQVQTQVIENANQALSYYQQVAETEHLSTAIVPIQARLRRLNLLIDLRTWLQSNTLIAEATALQPQIQLQIAEILDGALIELPPSRTAIYAQLSFAENLMSLEREGWHENRDHFTIATEFAERALQQAEVLQDQRAISYAFGVLGGMYEQAGRSPQPTESSLQAQQLTESALGIAQAIQAWDIAYQWQWQLGRIYTKRGDIEKAIAYYEAAAETLNTVRSDLLAIETDVQFSFRDKVEPVYRELVELLLRTDRTVKPSQNKLEQAIQQIDTLRLSELENFLRCNLAQAVEPPQVDDTAAIVHPIILENQFAVLLELPNSPQLQFHTNLVSRDEVERTLNELRRELEFPYQSATVEALSQQVYDWLIRPFSTLLAENQVKTLVFVLDGVLRNVPIAALYDGERYLIEEYAIALTPGLQLIEPQPVTNVKLNTLAFGLSQVPPTDTSRQFTPLENVELELEEIQSQIPGEVFLNQEFTSAALQELMRQVSFPVVHLATHGQFSSIPEETFVLAWDRQININDLSTILQRRDEGSINPIELLVLSACETAAGDDRATLGLAGIAIQSGARSTIASLWNVDDRATAELMGRFYRELTNPDAITKVEALRRAQLSILRTAGYESPFFWAPYILIGNWL
jgi:CHAT domain-containing protein